jgi:hypothetical protein
MTGEEKETGRGREIRGAWSSEVESRKRDDDRSMQHLTNPERSRFRYSTELSIRRLMIFVITN